MIRPRIAAGVALAGAPPAAREATSAAAAAAEQERAAAAASAAWLRALHADGPVRDEAITRLHALLLRAARFEAHRRLATRPHLREALDDLTQQAADDALVAVLGKLDTFRGESRFTTWAAKFAVLEAAVALRRHAWQGRELAVEPDAWPAQADRDPSPARHAEGRELLHAVRAAIAEDLTPHQREVLVAVTLSGVPIDVLAERLGTTRGALYKTLHDARARLRKRLGARGYDLTDYDTGARR
jgi:RNA polymerase sigma-70 factor, ECF subfamily